MHPAHTKYTRPVLALTLGGKLVFGVPVALGVLATSFHPGESRASDLPDMPGVVAAANSNHAAGLTHTVEHQQIIFSWHSVTGARHYRLLS